MDLNEAGLDAAAREWDDFDPEAAKEQLRGAIEAYFEHAEIDTKRRLHPSNKDGHISGNTKKFEVGGVSGYITVNCFPGTQEPAEILLHGVGKEGSIVSGLMDLVAIFMSIGLQYGIPLEQYLKFMIGMDFEPKDQEYKSIPDHIGRYLRAKYGQ